MVSSQRAKTMASAPATASSTEVARASGPSSPASASACDSSFEASTTDSSPRTRFRASALPMLPTPTIAVVNPAPFRAVDSDIVDLVGEQPEGLVDPDQVDCLPVLGNESVVDAEEVERRKVRWPAALGDGAVPHASGGEPIVFGDNVRPQGAPIGHRPAADRQSAREGGAAVRRPARVLDVVLGDCVDVLGAPG